MKLCSSGSGEVSEKDPSSECSVLGTVTRSSTFTFDISTRYELWLGGLPPTTWFLVYRQSGLNLPRSLVQERRQGLDARQATRLTGLDQGRSQRCSDMYVCVLGVNHERRKAVKD